jgi:hypothetical protein
MTDSDNATLRFKVTSVENFLTAITELREAQFSHLTSASALAETIVKVNENGASFYEKIILFDSATIVLSLSFLGALSSHMPGGHLPRHPITWLLCPSWALFLFSIYFFSRHIVTFHNLNVRLVKQLSSLSSSVHYGHIASLIRKASQLVEGEIITKNDPPIDVGELFSAASEALQKIAVDEGKAIEKLIEESTKESRSSGAWARLGYLATTLALILLCVFAIETLLAV